MTKTELRRAVWDLMRESKVARFPGARGRIPNFKGAERCAGLVAELDVWKKARAIKANPDSPQRAIRHLALKQGKTVYMAVPRLREEKCFVELDPEMLEKKIYEASSIKGAFDHGRQVSIEEMKRIDLIVCGSVAVRRDGARVGKGGGYSDLEYGLARDFKMISARTPVITTVHPLQIVDVAIDLKPHDIPLDFIITPDEIIESQTLLPRPKGIYWNYLDQEKIGEIPVLKKRHVALAARASRRRISSR
ncbi:MAG TPA: 5-formyltetrahydrofolate cyclo-ligase [Blastocatellia bacterium]|nr:5-formyltetrahydrofolate cyclo-ligase [Blastocatellia bacterium]